MTSPVQFVHDIGDEQMQADPQQFDANVVCGPKPLAMALKYLRYGCVGGWSAETVTTLVLAFLPTLHQRALRKREKLNAQGANWLPTIMPALRALDVSIQSHTELSLAVSPVLSKILNGASEDLGNFICILIAALQKVPFPIQMKVMVSATEKMLANHSDLLVNLFAGDALSTGLSATAMVPSRFVLAPHDLKNGMKVHFKCMDNPTSKAQNLRLRQDGYVDGNGWFGARATWTVGLVGEHDGSPVVTLRADVKEESCYLHLSDTGTLGRGTGGSDCEFLVISQAGSFISLQSHSGPLSSVCIGESDTKNANVQIHFTMLLAAPVEQKITRSIVGRFAKLEGNNKIPHAEALNQDRNSLMIASSDLKDGLRVHFKCMSRQNEKAQNLRVGEDGHLEGCGGRGARATWTVGLVGQHEDAPIVTLCVNVKGKVSYLRVTEDGQNIDGHGTGDSSSHFIVRTHDSACVELQWLRAPSVKVRIGVSDQALEPGTSCENEEQFRFMIVAAARSETSWWRQTAAGDALGKIKSVLGGDFPLSKMKLTPEQIENGMRVHVCCLGRSGTENRNLRVRSDGDVEGRGGFGVRATWTVHSLDNHKGAVVLALRAHIDGQSCYLRAAVNGTKIDGRGTGGPDCLFSVCVSGQDGTVGLHSLMWPSAKITVGTCGKLLDPLSESVCDNQAFNLLRASNADRAGHLAGKFQQAPKKTLTSSSLISDLEKIRDGMKVHLMSRGSNKNLRVRPDGDVEGCGAWGLRATWTVGLVGELGGAVTMTLQSHIEGRSSYLRATDGGNRIDCRGTGDSDCHFVMTMPGSKDGNVQLHSALWSNASVSVGTCGNLLDPFSTATCEGMTFKLFRASSCASATAESSALQPAGSAQNLGLSQEVHPQELPINADLASSPLAHAMSKKKLEVVTSQTLCHVSRVHLQCNSRRGAQRQNLRLCANGDVQGLGMFGKPATWTLRTVGDHNGSPIVTLHSMLQGVPHFLRATKQGQKIDGRGQGGVECQFMMKTLHVPSCVALHPVVSPLARLGVGVDGKLLDPFASESDLHFSFSLFLHSTAGDWLLVEESTMLACNGADHPTELTEEAIQQEWSAMDSKEGQSGDDW